MNDSETPNGSNRPGIPDSSDGDGLVRWILAMCLEGVRTADNWHRWTPVAAAKDAYSDFRFHVDGVVNGDTFVEYDEAADRAEMWIRRGAELALKRRWAGRTREERTAVLEQAVAAFERSVAP